MKALNDLVEHTSGSKYNVYHYVDMLNANPCGLADKLLAKRSVWIE